MRFAPRKKYGSGRIRLIDNRGRNQITGYGANIKHEIDQLADYKMYGQVINIVGLLIHVGGVTGSLSIGDNCMVHGRSGRKVMCEVVGFAEGNALVMPFSPVDGIGMGARVEVCLTEPAIHPSNDWLGRVIDAFGRPADGKGHLASGTQSYPIHISPPPAHMRKRLGGKVDLGVRAMNTFLTTCQGQRMGIFSGSGIGKSTLLAMMARNTNAEVNVIGLIGERGREAKEFIEDHLGEEGMKRSVIILATSDESPLARRQAAYLTLSVAEYFRDQPKEVLVLMDSVTRFAMAQREISLSAGEPPTTKGYTPSVFSQLPRLLERAGPGLKGQGSITGLFTVLVEGDDHNEPVSDAVRGILDGHVVLDRVIAERGRYPAINILKSISRTMPACNSPEQNAAVNRAKTLMATYEDMAELIRLGAYRRGSDPGVDEAIHFQPALEAFLAQDIEEATDFALCYERLYEALNMTEAVPAPSAETESQPIESPASGP